MNNLESIVPPLELCKFIPEGKFAESALVFNYHECGGGHYTLIERRYAPPDKPLIPAPTLQEILAAIGSSFDARITCEYHFGLWEVAYSYYPQEAFAVDEDNPVIAALRVWLELERKKNEQQG